MMKNEKNENTVFEDGEYVVWSNEEIQVGDTVELTTAEMDFDAKTGYFESTHRCFDISAEILSEDLSEYVPERSNNGGRYGYAMAKVIDVVEVME